MSPAPANTDTAEQKRPTGLPLRMQRNRRDPCHLCQDEFLVRTGSVRDGFLPTRQGREGSGPIVFAAVPEIPCPPQMGGRGYRAMCAPREQRPAGNAFPMYRSRTGSHRRKHNNTSNGLAGPRPLGLRKRRNCRPTTPHSQGSVPKGPLLSRVRIRGLLRQPPWGTSKHGITPPMSPSQPSALDEQSARNPRKTAGFWLSKTRFTELVRPACCGVHHGISGTGHGT